MPLKNGSVPAWRVFQNFMKYTITPQPTPRTTITARSPVATIVGHDPSSVMMASRTAVPIAELAKAGTIVLAAAGLAPSAKYSAQTMKEHQTARFHWCSHRVKGTDTATVMPTATQSGIVSLMWRAGASGEMVSDDIV